MYGNLEHITNNNTNYRKIIYTTDEQQLVVMSINTDSEIGFESHDSSQFIRIEEGIATVIYEQEIHILEQNDFIIIPNNTYHNIINKGNIPLKLYTIYSPPVHDYINYIQS